MLGVKGWGSGVKGWGIQSRDGVVGVKGWWSQGGRCRVPE